MAFRMRSSKFRHVFGRPYKKEQCYECIPITKNAHDSNFCAVNPRFIAIVTESTGGGAFVVIPMEKAGRLDMNSPKVCGHSGPVLDIKWSPFNDCIIASCSDDSTVKIWQIPDEGLTSNLTDWQVDLHGHQRRVGFLEWHPTAENILLSAGYDFQCILWNIESAEPIRIIDCHTDTIFSISWNLDGTLFSTTSKDKMIRIINPRDGVVVKQGKGHQGPKASKVVFLGNKNKLFTTGFSRMSERQFAVWDANNLDKALIMESVDSSSGVLFPFYDQDTNVVYLAGKGDGNIRYFEITDTSPFIHRLNQYQSASPQRGLGVMPKRGIDPSKCEIMRFYKLHTIKNKCEPISMIVPRKSEMFQDDLYPATASICPSLSTSEWLEGQDRGPILVSLKDGAMSGASTITTYKAVRKNSGRTSPPPSNDVDISSKQVSSITTTPTNKINISSKTPNSINNINRLTSIENDGNERSHHLKHEKKTENVNNRIAAFERKSTPPNKVTSTPSSQISDLRVDKKVWSQNTPNGTNPRHIPSTDPELRKAYFQQVEEIGALKEQISLKDKRIRQLEEELDQLRSTVHTDGVGESSC